MDTVGFGEDKRKMKEKLSIWVIEDFLKEKKGGRGRRKSKRRGGSERTDCLMVRI